MFHEDQATRGFGSRLAVDGVFLVFRDYDAQPHALLRSWQRYCAVPELRRERARRLRPLMRT